MGGIRKFLRRARRDAGFSLIEIMIAGGLIAFIAVALMPAIFSVVDNSRTSGFKAICTGAVRAKIQEYLNGIADNSGIGGSGYIPTGFEYTKSRYQLYGSAVCSQTPSAASPGFREAVFGNSIQSGQEFVPGSTSQFAIMNGFQLWVMIRRYNPRVLQLNGTLNTTNGVPTRDCPSQYYQFYSLGDALEVTVTGMVRTDPGGGSGGRNCQPVGKLYDVGHASNCPATLGSAPNPLLTCSATELIYPPRVPFRYYLANDGKIRNYQASIAFANGGSIKSTTEAMESHFRSVWMQGSGNVVANIRSFAVSPDNRWVFTLRPGELARYGPCYDDGTTVKVNGVDTQIGGDVTVNGITFKSTPDCPKVPSIATYTNNVGPDGKSWYVDPNIENIAVDFGSDLSDPTKFKVYGMFNTGATSVGASGNSGILVATLPTSPNNGTRYDTSWTESNTFALAGNRPRIRGMFISQTFPAVAGSTFPNLFFFDNTCYTGSTTNAGSSGIQNLGYCASVFNAADTTQQQVMRELPLQVEGISY